MVQTRKIDVASFRSHVPEFALEGDSRPAASYGNGGLQKPSTGVAFWIETLSRQRVRIPYDLCFAVAGSTTADILARADTVAASRAAGVIVLVGTNDPKASVGDLQTTITNYTTSIQKYLDSGKIVIVIPELPRGGGNVLAGTALRLFMSYVRWLQNLAVREGVFVADVWQLLVDPTSASAVPKTSYFYDGLHLAPIANFYVGRQVAAILSTLYPEPFGVLVSSAADLYHATENQRGNQIPNGMALGAGGSLSTGASGAFENNSFNYANHASFTFTGAMVDDAATGKRWQQITLNGTPTNASPQIDQTQSFNAAQLVNGGVYEALCEFEVDAGAANCYVPGLSCFINTSPSAFISAGGGSGAGYCPPVAFSGVIRTPRFTIGGGTISGGNISRVLYGVQNLAPTLVARFGRSSMRQIFGGEY